MARVRHDTDDCPTDAARRGVGAIDSGRQAGGGARARCNRRRSDRTLAADVMAATRPKVAMALATAGRSLPRHRGRRRLCAGAADAPAAAGRGRAADAARTDSVAPLGAVKVTAGRAEALVTVNPGDGVLPEGGDSDPGRRCGVRVSAYDAVQLAAFAIAGIASVSVREPRLSIYRRATITSSPPSHVLSARCRTRGRYRAH